MLLEFTIQETLHSVSAKPSFRTQAADIGEMFLRSPECFGLQIPDKIRAQIQELFPKRGSVESILRDIQKGARSHALQQIQGLRIDCRK